MNIKRVKPTKFRIATAAMCITLVTACGQQDTNNQSKEASLEVSETIQTSTLKSGIEIANMDKTIRPQDDFYRYVNGTWLDNTLIPDDKSSYGSFTILGDKSRKDVKAIIEETAELGNAEQGSDAQKVG